jgi:hypothetical protein
VFGKEIPVLREISKQLQTISKDEKDINKWELEELSRTFDKVAEKIETDV